MFHWSRASQGVLPAGIWRKQRLSLAQPPTPSDLHSMRLPPPMLRCLYPPLLTLLRPPHTVFQISIHQLGMLTALPLLTVTPPTPMGLCTDATLVLFLGVFVRGVLAATLNPIPCRVTPYLDLFITILASIRSYSFRILAIRGDVACSEAVMERSGTKYFLAPADGMIKTFAPGLCEIPSFGMGTVIIVIGRS
jgi:hypothetical protein